MRRLLSIGFLIISIGFLFFFISLPQDQLQFSDLLVEENEYRQILSRRTKTNTDILSNLCFNDYPLFYDELKSRWYYSVDPQKPILDPTVSFLSSGEKIHLAFPEDITIGNSIPFAVYTESEYRLYELTISTLPLLHIECEDSDYLTGIELSDVHKISFSMFDNRSNSLYPFVKSEGSIHIRGNGSRFYDKKAFRIHLIQDKGTGNNIQENQIPLLGLRKDGDWLLYAAYNDQEKIREVFSSKLWFESCGSDNPFGINNGNEYRFIELFWNQQYCGLYALGYPIDAKQVGIRPDITGHYEDFLFKQKHWGPKADGPDPEYDGLILQFDAEQSDLNNGIRLTKLFFNMLENGATNGLWNNDEKNALDIWLFLKLIQATDTVNANGKMRNMFLTIRNSERGRIFLFTPYDMDISWGNHINPYNRITYPYYYDANDNSVEMTVNPVSILRQKDPDIIKLIQNRYIQLRAGGWSEAAIDTLIEGYEQDIFDSGAFVRDMERWPEGSYEEPSLGLSVFREYVHNRLRSMDEYIRNLSTDTE